MKITALLPLLLLIIPSSSYAWQHNLEVRSEFFNDNDGTHSMSFDQVFHWKDKTEKIGLGTTQTIIEESEGLKSLGIGCGIVSSSASLSASVQAEPG